jgi:hypothetical protein
MAAVRAYATLTPDGACAMLGGQHAGGRTPRAQPLGGAHDQGADVRLGGHADRRAAAAVRPCARRAGGDRATRDGVGQAAAVVPGVRRRTRRAAAHAGPGWRAVRAVPGAARRERAAFVLRAGGQARDPVCPCRREASGAHRVRQGAATARRGRGARRVPARQRRRGPCAGRAAATAHVRAAVRAAPRGGRFRRLGRSAGADRARRRAGSCRQPERCRGPRRSMR